VSTTTSDSNPFRHNAAGAAATGDFDVFLSYHWRDRAVVEPLAQHLLGEGLRVFLDRWYLRPGASWIRTLEFTLARCGAVAVCTGREMGPWQQREADAALERQVQDERAGKVFPVIPVLLPGAEAPLGFLRQNTWVDLRERADNAQGLEILAKAIRGERPRPDLQDAVARSLAGVCPYRGLLYFREEDAAFFFGREAATSQLAEAVDRLNLVAVVGASGSGKSSVVRAGLLPALRRRGENAWEIVTLVPGDRPLYNLSATLLPFLEPEMSEVKRLGEIQDLADKLEAGKMQLRDVVQRVLELQPGTQRLLLVVDQWEELFTLCESIGARQRFIDNLLEATRTSALKVVLTLRGDYFGRAVTSQRELSDRLQGAQVNLGPMTEDELRCAIVEPARKVGLGFEDNLVELMLEQALGEPGHLPLLEFVLRGLWERRQGRLMHRAAYDDMGQLEGAIAKRAEALYEELTRGDAQAAQRIRSIVLRLVRPGEGELDSRRRALLADFDAPTTKLIDRLANERLLVSSAAAGGQPSVEVAHEALVAHWGRLREWVDADRQFMAWRQRLDDEAAEWERKRRSAGLLLQGLRLAEARDWLKRRREDLSERECTYIKASARRRQVRLTTTSAVAGIGIMVVLAFGILATWEQQRANAARDRAEGLVSYMVDDLLAILRPLSRLDVMMGITDRVNAYYEQLGDAVSPQVQYRHALNLNIHGDTLLDLGRPDGARKAYEQALAICERLARANPSSANLQAELSLTYRRLGDVAVAKSQFDAARKAYEQGIAIGERLVRAESSNIALLSILSDSYDKLGDMAKAAGQLDAGRKAYEQGLAIRERLTKADPSNDIWKRDVFSSYYSLGDVAMAADQPDAARKAYEQGFAILEQLARAKPSEKGWQYNLWFSYNKLGNAAVAAGQLDAARKDYEQGLAIVERLVRAEPLNARWLSALSESYEKLGDVAVAADQLDVAHKAYEQELAIEAQLAKDFPSPNATWQRNLSLSYKKLGEVNRKEGKTEEALDRFEQSRRILERLVKLDPTNATWQDDLAFTQARITELRGQASVRR
jgi:tetratricopeptide (TPR) repeat protein